MKLIYSYFWMNFDFQPPDQTISLESYRFQTAWGGGTRRIPPPKESQCSGHFETKVANETTHKLGVADQKILSD